MVNNFEFDVSVHSDIVNGKEDYGRDSKLTNVFIEKVYVSSIVNSFITAYPNGNDIINYCIDRIVRCYKPWDVSKYNVEVIQGYYGEEIARVTWQCFDKVVGHIQNLKYLKSDIDRIFYALKLEYGYILDTISNYNKAEIIRIDINRIKPAQHQYYMKLDNEVIETYMEYPYAKCICVETNGYYKIIDGYHRFAAAKRNNQNFINIIILKEE